MNNHLNKKFYKEEWFFEAVMEYMGVSVMVTDLDENIIFVNTDTEELFGYSRDELIGKHPSITNAEENADVIQASISKTVLGGQEWHGRIKNRRKNGELFLLDLTVRGLRNKSGELVALIGFQKDVSEIVDALDLQKATNDKLRLSIENMLEGYIMHKAIFDENDRMVDFEFLELNPSAQRILNVTKEEMVGKTASQLFPNICNVGLMDKYADVVATGESTYINDFYYAGDELDKAFDISCYRIDENHFVCVFRDVTKRRETKTALENSEQKYRSIFQELKKSNEELEQFAYVASHDLQEPLRVVSSYCQLIHDKAAQSYYEDEEVDKYFSYIIDATDRMKKLIKELLDFSRVGRKDKPFETIDLQKVITEITTDFELYIKETNATIIVEDELPSITGIRFRIKQLLSNLISNALKFKSDKSPIVRIGCYPEENSWLFYISDNGIGIDPKYFDRIFGIFKRLYSRDEYPGTGIGLALCKRIVETHGGKIWADSGVDKGTTIYFTIDKHTDLNNWQAVCQK